jgi:hypothetical protein
MNFSFRNGNSRIRFKVSSRESSILLGLLLFVFFPFRSMARPLFYIATGTLGLMVEHNVMDFT